MGLQQASAQTSEHFSGRAAVRNLATQATIPVTVIKATARLGRLASKTACWPPPPLRCGDSVWGGGQVDAATALSVLRPANTPKWLVHETPVFWCKSEFTGIGHGFVRSCESTEGESAFGGTPTSGLVPGYRVSAGFYSIHNSG